MLKLPPYNIVIPTHAMFRDDPLSQELWETWSLLRALAWVNKYEFTPPMTIRELLDLHNKRKKNPIDVRGLQKRLRALKDLGWLDVRFTGRANVFVPLVPPVSQEAEDAAARREPASVTLPHFDEADSPRMTATNEDIAAQNHKRGEPPVRPELPVRGNSNSTVVVVNHDLEKQQQQHGVNPQFAPNSQFTPAADGVNPQFAPNPQFTPAMQPDCIPVMQPDCTPESMKILHQAGVEGRNLEMLAATVTPDVARHWAEWVPGAPQSFTDPVGYMVRRLLKDPTTEPPRVRASRRGKTVAETLAELRENISPDSDNSDVQTEDAEPSEGTRALDEIWNAALIELEGQMLGATFDRWLRGTRALGWEENDHVLIIGVHSSYAKEWLENRLNTTIQRTVTGIVGKSVGIRYVVPAGERA